MPDGNYQQPSSFDLYPVDAPLRKLTRLVWVDTRAAAGNTDRSIFFDEATSSLLQDAGVKLEIDAVGIMEDGSEVYTCKKIASFKRDGNADSVQVGATTTVSEHRDDAGASVTISQQANSLVRVAFTTGGVDVYRWTIFATITQTLLNS